MIVVPHAEPLLDDVADHRPRPHPRAVTSGLRPRLDDRRQLGALGLRQLRRRAWRRARQQAFDPQHLVPLQPSIDRAARHPELRRHLYDATPLDVPKHRAPPPPRVQIASGIRRSDKLAQLLLRRRRPPARADRLTCPRPRHDHPLERSRHHDPLGISGQQAWIALRAILFSSSLSTEGLFCRQGRRRRQHCFMTPRVSSDVEGMFGESPYPSEPSPVANEPRSILARYRIVCVSADQADATALEG